jgi:hypothetical protein
MFAVLDFSDFAFIGLLLIVLTGGMTFALKPRDKARLFRLEQKLDLLLQHAGIQYVPQFPPTAAEALLAGNKIQAIVKYREATGAGLKEAKTLWKKHRAVVSFE